MRYQVILSLVAALVLAFACKEKQTEQSAPAEPATAPKPEDVKAPEISNEKGVAEASSALEQYPDAPLAIGHLLQADTISWDQIKEKYEIAKPQVEAIDAKHNTTYAVEITEALDAIKAGESVDVNRHVVTKGLQHVTVLTITDLIDRLVTDDLKDAPKIAERIRKVFAAIEPTFERRDSTVYGGKATLVPAAQEALFRLAQAKTKAALASAAMEFSALLSKTYVLSVLFEMKGVEEFCSGTAPDPDKCAVKRTEAGIYYRIIRPSVAAADKEADAKIEAMIHSDKAIPKYETARDLLAKALKLDAKDLTF